MKLKTIILNVLLLFTIVLSCSDETGEIIEKIKTPYKEIINVSYGNDTNQTFDIYLPENRNSKTKTMILIHGGAWVSGDKTDMNTLITLYKKDFPNIAIVSINYRLANETNPPFPMQINDITEVINHLKQYKNSYKISEEFGLLGISAGGHLALLWSYAFDAQKNIKMVVGIVSPTNFTDPVYLNSTNPQLKLFLSIYNINPDDIGFLEKISPLHQVNSSSPPTIFFNGEQDPLIPNSQGYDLKNKLTALGIENEFTLYPNAGHGWETPELLDTWEKIKNFTKVHLTNEII
ncbi:alpha/beta hydrolase [Aestuariibaculum suncheonense]|uniref:Alpha/beta hydrolase n=1 Tax=Aestuariibaculum suncheonense TaxID=1028745 RepID=A0A8J6QIJ5_9FLAO|nr:alpha/beta hydrolase [Aestuariibaculum suncheonense]MBD0835656.1 alpha/beta hydrolase [Aestuariibaculum suncheonense]